jgi:hypothetical protein
MTRARAAARKSFSLRPDGKIYAVGRRKNFETSANQIRRIGMSRVLWRNFIVLLAWGAGVLAAGEAMEGELPARDVLVFKDGDRLNGQLIREEGNVLVFKSDRFGEQRVPADAAVVIKGQQPPVPLAEGSKAAPVAPVTVPTPAAAPAVPAAVAEKAAERAEAEKVSMWERFSPAVLTAKVREYFGPWKGRIAFSTEVISDTADRSTLSLETRLSRKWTKDEVQLTGRYDYAQTNDLTTTDMIKADGLVRHNFTKNSFIQYRPTLEWNRATFRSGLPADYVLLQQEIGAGINLLTSPARKLRVGVSENLFDVWTTPDPASHTSRTAESAFVETELRLPWGLLLTDRGVYYYSFSTKGDGWENRIELTKKFTETLSTAIRHELRRGSPDGRAQDYDRLKLLLGLDF